MSIDARRYVDVLAAGTPSGTQAETDLAAATVAGAIAGDEAGRVAGAAAGAEAGTQVATEAGAAAGASAGEIAGAQAGTGAGATAGAAAGNTSGAAAGAAAANVVVNLKADKATTVLAAGLATGGGTLGGNRTITVTAANQAQAEAGAADTVAMTPERATQHFNARVLDPIRNAALQPSLAGALGKLGEYRAFAALMASTDTFATGDVLRTGDGAFSFSAAAPAATDHDVVTAGGVKLYALPDEQGRWSSVALGLSDGLDARARLEAAVNTRGRNRLIIPPNAPVKLNSEGVLTASEVHLSGGTFDCSGGGRLKIQGVQAALPALSGDVAAGATVLNFAAPHGLAVGDHGNIWDRRPRSGGRRRPTYHDGFRFIVSDVLDADSVRIFGRVSSAFAAANVDCFKVTGGPVTVTDTLFTPPSTPNTDPIVQVFRRQGVRLQSLTCPRGAGYTAISVGQCYDFQVTDPRGDVNAGDAYPLVAFSNQVGLIKNVTRLYSTRHIVAIGGGDGPGATPDRYVKAVDSIMLNSGTAAAGDMHGTAFECEYSRCVMSAALAMGGRDNVIDDCDIYADAVDNTAVTMGEMDRGFLRMSNCRFYTYGSNVTYGTIFAFMPWASDDILIDVVNPLFIHRGAPSSDVRQVVLQAPNPTNWDAAGGVYPSTGLGDGDTWIATSAGVVSGESYAIGDVIVFTAQDATFQRYLKDAKVRLVMTGARVQGLDTLILVRVQGSLDVTAQYSVHVSDNLDGPPGTLVSIENVANTNVPLRLPAQTVKTAAATTTGTASIVTGFLPYRWAYPRKPVLVGAPGYAPVPDAPAGIGKTMVSVFDMRSDQIRLELATVAGTNWAAAQDLIASATVAMREEP